MYAANTGPPNAVNPTRPDCGGEGVRKMEPALAVVECQNPVGYCN